MTEIAPLAPLPPPPAVEPVPSSTAADPRGLGWLLSGFVLPIGSPTFYRTAVRKSTGAAVLFFFIFTTLIAGITTISVGRAMAEVSPGIDEAYARGRMPDITISHGVARVDGPQPFILQDDPLPGDGVLIAIDTTGKLTRIDTADYQQGILLTRTDLQVLNPDEYQSLPLRDIQAMLNTDPIVMDRESMGNLWRTFSAVVVIGAALALFLWHFVFGLMLLALLGLVTWGLTTLVRKGTQFGPVLVAGIYATVPAFYLAHLMNRSGVAFPSLQTLLLMPLWVAALWLGLGSTAGAQEHRPRLWTALIGLPMLIIFVVDVFRPFPSPWGVAALWGITIATVLILIGVRLYQRQAGNTPPVPA